MKKLALYLLAVAVLASSSLATAQDHHHAPGKLGKGAAAQAQKPWGVPGEARAVTRTVTLVMDDSMRFTPDSLSFRQGETVRFVIRNKGAMLHEMVIGTKKELDDHAATMLRFPAMQHDEASMVHVAPGKTGGLIWTFNRSGQFDFACLIAGHYQAGMVGRISVAAVSR